MSKRINFTIQFEADLGPGIASYWHELATKDFLDAKYVNPVARIIENKILDGCRMSLVGNITNLGNAQTPQQEDRHQIALTLLQGIAANPEAVTRTHQQIVKQAYRMADEYLAHKHGRP